MTAACTHLCAMGTRHMRHTARSRPSSGCALDQIIVRPFVSRTVQPKKPKSQPPRRKMTTRGSRSRQVTAEPPPDWLPCVRNTPIACRESVTRFAQSQRHRNWYMALVCAMDEHEPQNSIQSTMLFKLYFFVRDYLPRGLSSDLAHIEGNKVMGQLLSHSERKASRHKLTKTANTAFQDLETWMGTHATWRSALAEARKIPKTQSKQSTGSNVSIDNTGKAPGLHSPEGNARVPQEGFPS